MSEYFFPTHVVFGCGELAQLGTQAAKLGRRALIVTGESAMRRLGILSRCEKILGEAGVSSVVFEGAEADPSLETVDAATNSCREEACDLVIGLGGGSALDVAKAAAIIATKDGTARDYQAGKPIAAPGLPFIAIPTTAGTGTEGTGVSVLTNRATREKKSFRSPYMYPVVAIVDPELMVSMPPQVTAWSGMDAFTQALEAYVSTGATPITDALAFQAITMIWKALPRAFRDGGDLEARTDMACGALVAAMAFSNSRLGAVHGIAHPLGILYGIPHGLACGVILPYVVELNLEAADAKYTTVAGHVGLKRTGNLPRKILGMLGKLNMPTTLADYAIQESDWPLIIERSLPSGSLKANPRPFGPEEIASVLGRVSG